MSRPLRYFEAGAVYEICFRAKNSLPLVAYKCINFIIQCVLARTQRDEKVILCHDIWNGSHPHILVVSKDVAQLANFYSEIQKRLTDILKCLLGLESLEIWEGYASVIKIGDLNAVMNRIAYLYSNPAKDDLEESIDKFPGASSWDDYQKCLGQLEAHTEANFPWIRLPSIPLLSGRTISEEEDLDVITTLSAENKKTHLLRRDPNAWMKCFDINDDREVEAINKAIAIELQDLERVARDKRNRTNKSVLGAVKLKAQAILKFHSPKKKETKICIISTIKDIRLEFLERVKRFSEECKLSFRRWRNGELSVTWPPGAFKPPMPPSANLLAT